MALLDTYEPERIAFARRLVKTTDRAFTLVTSPGRLARFVRLNIFPRVIPPIFDFTATRRLMFRTVSQIAINYRHSSLSQGDTGPIKAGDRLPWVDAPATNQITGDNFTPLANLNWQIHIYGQCEDSIRDYCQQHNIPLHIFPWPPAATTGLGESALYLIRPDAYIAFADPAPTVEALDKYLKALRS